MLTVASFAIIVGVSLISLLGFLILTIDEPHSWTTFFWIYVIKVPVGTTILMIVINVFRIMFYKRYIQVDQNGITVYLTVYLKSKILYNIKQSNIIAFEYKGFTSIIGNPLNFYNMGTGFLQITLKDTSTIKITKTFQGKVHLIGMSLKDAKAVADILRKPLPYSTWFKEKSYIPENSSGLNKIENKSNNISE